MTKAHDFIAGHARSGKSAAEIKTTVDTAYRDKALGLTSIYYIIKKLKAGENTHNQQNLSTKKTKWTMDIYRRRCHH
jgi:hypothetical protein